MNHPIKKENMLELARYQQHLCAFPRLKYLFLELTDRCNLSCRHCGSSCTANNHTYLPFEKIQEVLLQVAEAYDARDIMRLFFILFIMGRAQFSILFSFSQGPFRE